MTASVRDHVLIITVAAVVLFPNLGRAHCGIATSHATPGALEMRERGDWVVPMFNAELRGHKPVLLYWLMMSAYGLFGVSEFAARFWSATLGVGTVVVTYHIGRYLFNAATGRWAAIVLATALMFDVASRAATPDSTLIFFSTLGLAGFAAATFRQHKRTGGSDPTARQRELADVECLTEPYSPLPWSGVLLMYGPLGLAVLAKGPVGVVLPMAVVGMFLLIKYLPPATAAGWRRQPRAVRMLAFALRPFAARHFLRTLWSMRPLSGVLLVLAIALPWYVMVGIRTEGAWLREFFLQHNVGRAMQPMEGHGGGWWYYPVAILVGLFPWSILTVPTLLNVWQGTRQADRRQREGYLLCACWVAVYVVLFSIARTKLPSYVTPAYPAAALLIGRFLRQWVAGAYAVWNGWLRVGWGALSLVGVALVVGLGLAARNYLPGDEWLAAVGLIPLVGGLAGWRLAESNRPQAAAMCLAVTAALLSVGILGIGTARVDRHQQSHLLLQAVAARSDRPELAAFGTLEPSWVFYARQPIRMIPSNQPQRVDEFLQGGPHRFLITTSEFYRRVSDRLPFTVQPLESVPYFLKDSQLLLLGRVEGATVPRLADPSARIQRRR